jgi:hypothetical protein
MTVAEALEHVNTEIARIERANPGKELHPWKTNDAPESTEWWGLVQQRLALSKPNPHLVPCCADLNLNPPTRSAAQLAATAALASRRARTPVQIAA